MYRLSRLEWLRRKDHIRQWVGSRHNTRWKLKCYVYIWPAVQIGAEFKHCDRERGSG